MKRPGQVILFNFSYPDDRTIGKFRPALIIAKLPGPRDEWLICMISTQLRYEIKNFDEIIHETDPDFSSSGLKSSSLIRIGRFAVVDGSILLGSIGEISSDRLTKIKHKLAAWLLNRKIKDI